jgi:sirohydrochlorin cobaltochelatase
LKQNLTQAIEQWIRGGARSIGQILIRPLPDGAYELRHLEDAGSDDLELHQGPASARPLSLLDDKGEYRRLKTAPTLRRGWRLTLTSGTELRQALDHFYPAMTAVWFAYLQGDLNVLSLRETLGRQTGMYAAAKRLLDEEGQQAVGATCAGSNCLKRTVWSFAPGQPLQYLPASITTPDIRPVPGGGTEIPMLCQEACNILVPVLREVVKTRERATAPDTPQPPQVAH